MRRRGHTLTDEERRERITEGGALAILTQHPSWPVLEKVAAQKEERLRKVVLAHALGPDPLDQRQVDYVRGYLDGMRWFLAQPHGAEVKLERLLQEAQREEVTT